MIGVSGIKKTENGLILSDNYYMIGGLLMSENVKKINLANELVKVLGISLKSAYNKLNGTTPFTLHEYLFLCELWGDEMACSLIKNKELINDTNRKNTKEE